MAAQALAPASPVVYDDPRIQMLLDWATTQKPEAVQLLKDAAALIAQAKQRRRRLCSGASVVVPVVVRVPVSRPRERRQRRHVSRSTSSADSGDDGPGEPPPAVLAAFTHTFGHESCWKCGTTLVWSNGRLVCPKRGCGGVR